MRLPQLVAYSFAGRPVFGGGGTVSPQQALLQPPIGHGEQRGHVGVVEVGIGGDRAGIVRGVIMVVVLDGGRVRLSSSLGVFGSAARPGGFGGGAAGGRQDLKRPLGDGGRVGAALLIAADMVSKKAAVTLQGDGRNPPD